MKGKYRAVSNFTFKVKNNVICESRPHLSGYLLEVCPSSDTNQKRYEVVCVCIYIHVQYVLCVFVQM